MPSIQSSQFSKRFSIKIRNEQKQIHSYCRPTLHSVIRTVKLSRQLPIYLSDGQHAVLLCESKQTTRPYPLNRSSHDRCSRQAIIVGTDERPRDAISSLFTIATTVVWHAPYVESQTPPPFPSRALFLLPYSSRRPIFSAMADLGFCEDGAK